MPTAPTPLKHPAPSTSPVPLEPPIAPVDQNDELFDVVDDQNTAVSTATRQRCHAEGLLHRSTHVLLFRRRASLHPTAPTTLQVLLQRRSPRKTVAPHLWDVSVAEHLSAGEQYDAATVRGLREELAVNLPKDSLVRVRGPYLAREVYPEAGVTENMFTCLFAAEFDGPVVVDGAEVDAVEWWDVHRLLQAVKATPERFTRWAHTELRSVDLVELAKTTLGEL